MRSLETFEKLAALWYSVLFMLQSHLPKPAKRGGMATWVFALIIVVVIVIGAVAIYFIVIPPGPTTT